VFIPQSSAIMELSPITLSLHDEACIALGIPTTIASYLALNSTHYIETEGRHLVFFRIMCP